MSVPPTVPASAITAAATTAQATRVGHGLLALAAPTRRVNRFMVLLLDGFRRHVRSRDLRKQRCGLTPVPSPPLGTIDGSAKGLDQQREESATFPHEAETATRLRVGDRVPRHGVP